MPAKAWLITDVPSAPDPKVTLRHVRDAAYQAIAVCAYRDAVTLLTSGLTLVTGRDRGELLLELGDALLRAGDWAGAVESFDEAAAAAKQADDARLLARARTTTTCWSGFSPGSPSRCPCRVTSRSGGG